MRVIDIQNKARRVGVIRLGAQTTGNGPGRKLENFRLTSNDKRALEAAALMYGGVVMPWANGSQRWQIITETSELPIEISNIPVSTQYEHWAQVGGKGSMQCIRRCDGCHIVGGIEGDPDKTRPCICPEDPIERSQLSKSRKACGLAIRMWVRLPELPDVGVWQVTSTSFYAAQEVPAIMDGIENLAQIGAHIRARLAIEVRTGGGKRFPVLSVRIDQSADELRQLAMEQVQRMKSLKGSTDPLQALAMKFGLDYLDGEVIEQAPKELPQRQVVVQPQPSQEELGDFNG